MFLFFLRTLHAFIMEEGEKTGEWFRSAQIVSVFGKQETQIQIQIQENGETGRERNVDSQLVLTNIHRVAKLDIVVIARLQFAKCILKVQEVALPRFSG